MISFLHLFGTFVLNSHKPYLLVNLFAVLAHIDSMPITLLHDGALECMRNVLSNVNVLQRDQRYGETYKYLTS